jgi:uncharacterized protein YceH (UPF0502 family)
MKIQLTPLEARVIGCLIEKQVTTPDQYPLSLNALTNACNQKSNRDPLMALSDQQIQEVVDALVRKSMILEKGGFGSRVPKYQQRFCNMEFSELKFTPLELAIVCELLLRGPQTPGELRTRATRMAELRDVNEVELALKDLAARQPDALVVQLPREAGRRDVRYAQLFTGAAAAAAPRLPEAVRSEIAMPAAAPPRDRLSQLEDQLRQLQEAVAELQRIVSAR